MKRSAPQGKKTASGSMAGGDANPELAVTAAPAAAAAAGADAVIGKAAAAGATPVIPEMVMAPAAQWVHDVRFAPKLTPRQVWARSLALVCAPLALLHCCD